MRHLRLFENFDRIDEMSDAELEKLVLADVRKLSKEDLKKLMAVPAEKKNEIKLANGWKWYLAEEDGERFRFLAKDEEDAEAGAAVWGAKLIGELDEDSDMEFEETPMDEKYANDRRLDDEYDDMVSDVSTDITYEDGDNMCLVVFDELDQWDSSDYGGGKGYQQGKKDIKLAAEGQNDVLLDMVAEILKREIDREPDFEKGIEICCVGTGMKIQLKK